MSGQVTNNRQATGVSPAASNTGSELSYLANMYGGAGWQATVCRRLVSTDPLEPATHGMRCNGVHEAPYAYARPKRCQTQTIAINTDECVPPEPGGDPSWGALRG